MKKRIIIIVSVLICLALGSFGVFKHHEYSNPEIILNQKAATIEFGSDVASFLEENIKSSTYQGKDKLSDIHYTCDDIDDFDQTIPVGSYKIDYQYRDTHKSFTLLIKDTVAPVVTATKTIEGLQNNKINYNECIEAKDLSTCKTSVDDSGVNYNTPGTYTVKYIVSDHSGNKTTLDLPVTIKEVVLETTSANFVLDKNGNSKFAISTNSPHSISFASSDTNIVTIDAAGNVTAVNPGTATIRANVDGKELSRSVTVKAPKEVARSTTTNEHTSSHTDNDISGTVYRTKTGDCYHRSGCRYLSRSCISISKSNAISSGLRPCSICNP